MSLQLNYVDSTALLLPDILSALVSRHINYKLKDTFRIITPNSVAREDVEEMLLTIPELEDILIGKSILSFSDFWRNICYENPRARPLASSQMEKKAIRMALKKDNPKKEVNPRIQQQYWSELKRIHKLICLDQTGRPSEFRAPFLHQFQSILHQQFSLWNPEKAMEETFNYLRNQGSADLQTVEEIYFVGFYLPTGELFQCVSALLEGCPSIALHLFLPRVELGMDPQHLLANSYEGLESRAEKVNHFPHQARPQVSTHSYLSPYHESCETMAALSQPDRRARILAPSSGSTRDYLQNFLLKNRVDSGFTGSSTRSLNLIPFEVLNEVKNNGDPHHPIRFFDLMKQALPIFQASRQRMARENNVVGLNFLEACLKNLESYYQAEKIDEEVRPLSEWIEDLTQEFIDLNLNNPQYPIKRIPLRSIDHSGLGQVEELLIVNLNEGVYPPYAPSSVLLESRQDPLFFHEKKINLDQSLYLARSAVKLSFVDYNLRGRSLSPSPLLGQHYLDSVKKHGSLFPKIILGEHPYFTENIQREKLRKTAKENNIDQGNFRELKEKINILPLVQKRPLSASYIDDYAKCPWRFFAKWHLRLDEIPEEDLKIQPRLKGTLIHTLLEKTLKPLIPEYFRFKKIPPHETLTHELDKAFAELWEEIQKLPEAGFTPESILRDEADRLKDQVRGLLERDYQDWGEASQKMLPWSLEWNFGKKGGPPVSFPLEDGTSIPLSGGIDRIDMSEDEKDFLIIDYKSSSSELLSRDLRNRTGFQLYLYLYAVQQSLFPDKNPVGALYWDLKKLKKNQGIAKKDGYSVYSPSKPRGYSFVKNEDFEQILNDLETQLKKHLNDILDGIYPLDPPQCLGARCQFHEICRYENQPRS